MQGIYLHELKCEASVPNCSYTQCNKSQMNISNFFSLSRSVDLLLYLWHNMKVFKRKLWVRLTIFCGSFMSGSLQADFGGYWLWVTPDAIGWAMSSERIEVMSVPWGGCLSLSQGMVSGYTTFKIHQNLAVQQTTCSLKHIRHVDTSTPRCSYTARLRTVFKPELRLIHWSWHIWDKSCVLR